MDLLEEQTRLGCRVRLEPLVHEDQGLLFHFLPRREKSTKVGHAHPVLTQTSRISLASGLVMTSTVGTSIWESCRLASP